MDFHLDTLLNLPDVTVESCIYQDDEVYLILRFLTEGCDCPYCGNHSEELHQNRPILIRDLSVFGRESDVTFKNEGSLRTSLLVGTERSLNKAALVFKTENPG